MYALLKIIKKELQLKMRSLCDDDYPFKSFSNIFNINSLINIKRFSKSLFNISLFNEESLFNIPLFNGPFNVFNIE